MFINNTAGDFVGVGQDLPVVAGSTLIGIRIGVAGNYGDNGVWDDRPGTQLAVGIPGGVAFGTGNGTTATDGSLTYSELLKNSSGILDLTTPAGAHTIGEKVGFLRLVPTTVAGLATQDPSPSDGDTAFVTDATAPTFNGALTGGGSAHTNVHYDGSAAAWKAG
jgi:hypothetical protein